MRRIFVLAVTLTLLDCGGDPSRLVSSSASFDPSVLGAKPSGSAAPFERLAVADYAGHAVKIFNNSYQLTSTITQGLVLPLSATYDAKGNLYVSNCVSGSCAEASGPDVVDVNEYDKTGKEIFSYSKGLVIPFDVAVDKSGNLFVADGGLGKPSYVYEYRQLHKAPIAKCFTGLSNTGVAVDAAGDVFVSGDSSANGGGYLREYVHGLAGCSPRVPHIAFRNIGGLTLDHRHNLLACNEEVGVDILTPPYYKKAASTITVTPYSESVALNRANNLIFIVDIQEGTVNVATYPEGKLLKTLTQGLTEPSDAAVYP